VAIVVTPITPTRETTCSKEKVPSGNDDDVENKGMEIKKKKKYTQEKKEERNVFTVL